MDKKILIPYFYTLTTRYKTKITKITYILSNIVPVILYIGIALEKQNLLKIVLTSLIALGSYISIYEIGYIFNDSFSIDNEEKPTLRLEEKEVLNIKKNIKKIIIYKIVISIVLYVSLLLIYKNLNIVTYFLLITLTLIVYYIHNNFRSNNVTYITFFLLSTLRFFSPISFFLETNNQFSYLISIIFSNSLIRNFEEIGHKKYYIGNLNIYKIRHEFRSIYYLIVIFFINIFKINVENKIIVFYYMLIYRTILLSILKIKNRDEKK